MLDKLFRVHSEKNGAAMNGTASTKEGPPNGVRRALSERPTPDMLRRTDSMTAFHAQKEFQDRTVSIGNDEREYFVSGCLLLLDCARGDLERVQSVHTTKSKNLRRGSIQSRKRVAKKQPSPAAMPSFYQHQAGGNHAPPDRQQSMDNCKCTIC